MPQPIVSGVFSCMRKKFLMVITDAAAVKTVCKSTEVLVWSMKVLFFHNTVSVHAYSMFHKKQDGNQNTL